MPQASLLSAVAQSHDALVRSDEKDWLATARRSTLLLSLTPLLPDQPFKTS